MNKYILKDNRTRIQAYKVEKEKLMYKFLYYNLNFNKKLRKISYKIFDFYSNKFNKRGKIKSRCILSGRSRAISNEFGLSRIAFRDLSSKGFLNNIRKSSW
jgi:ribosomal protein S14